MTSALVHPQIRANADAIAMEFASAQPYRHVVLEDFFTPEYAHALLAQFPEFDTKHALNEAGLVGNKAVVERIRGIGAQYAVLDDLVKSEAFLALVSKLTSISDLLYDPYYFGGGTHENRHGQDLDPHIDFNRHPVEAWHRRLNLIVYLNPDWQADWGGNLEVHSDPHALDNKIKAITPSFNRCVIFETNEISWHGFNRIDLPAAHADKSRKSIALYFYTKTRPLEELGDTHSTIYVDRPLPARLCAGHQLDAQDMQILNVSIARRDQHIQRLYRNATAVQKQLEQANAALQRGALGRLIYFVRRFLQRLLAH